MARNDKEDGWRVGAVLTMDGGMRWGVDAQGPLLLRTGDERES